MDIRAEMIRELSYAFPYHDGWGALADMAIHAYWNDHGRPDDPDAAEMFNHLVFVYGD